MQFVNDFITVPAEFINVVIPWIIVLVEVVIVGRAPPENSKVCAVPPIESVFMYPLFEVGWFMINVVVYATVPVVGVGIPTILIDIDEIANVPVAPPILAYTTAPLK